MLPESLEQYNMSGAESLTEKQMLKLLTSGNFLVILKIARRLDLTESVVTKLSSLSLNEKQSVLLGRALNANPKVKELQLATIGGETIAKIDTVLSEQFQINKKKLNF